MTDPSTSEFPTEKIGFGQLDKPDKWMAFGRQQPPVDTDQKANSDQGISREKGYGKEMPAAESGVHSPASR